LAQWRFPRRESWPPVRAGILGSAPDNWRELDVDAVTPTTRPGRRSQAIDTVSPARGALSTA
jgi:hypothetical protein